MVLNRVQLLNSVFDVVLTEDASYSLVASIGFHDYFKSTIELCENGSREESLAEVIEG